MKLLRRTQFGNPILRQKAMELSLAQIVSPEIEQFIRDIQFTLEKRKYGVGLAAPQVGKGIALCVIGIKPTPTRPDLERQDMVLINPEIIQKNGGKTGKWEACISFGSNDNFPYAQAMRYEKIRLRWLDEKAVEHEQDFEGFTANVIQHEVDHLNGILFVDRVEDTKTYMTSSEYKKMIKIQND